MSPGKAADAPDDAALTETAADHARSAGWSGSPLEEPSIGLRLLRVLWKSASSPRDVHLRRALGACLGRRCTGRLAQAGDIRVAADGGRATDGRRRLPMGICRAVTGSALASACARGACNLLLLWAPGSPL
jgi:hypothetical protein